MRQEARRRMTELIKRLDSFNCSLADRALPDSRRQKVSELSLRDKAVKAGQKGANVRSINS
jgi:hypothetical protein